MERAIVAVIVVASVLLTKQIIFAAQRTSANVVPLIDCAITKPAGSSAPRLMQNAAPGQSQP